MITLIYITLFLAIVLIGFTYQWRKHKNLIIKHFFFERLSYPFLDEIPYPQIIRFKGQIKQNENNDALAPIHNQLSSTFIWLIYEGMGDHYELINTYSSNEFIEIKNDKSLSVYVNPLDIKFDELKSKTIVFTNRKWKISDAILDIIKENKLLNTKKETNIFKENKYMIKEIIFESNVETNILGYVQFPCDENNQKYTFQKNRLNQQEFGYENVLMFNKKNRILLPSNTSEIVAFILALMCIATLSSFVIF